MGKTHMKQCSKTAIGQNTNARIVIDLPNSEITQSIPRSVFFTMALLALPCILSTLKETSMDKVAEVEFASGTGAISFDYMDMLFRDFGHEGLVKKGDKVLIVASDIGVVSATFQYLNVNEIDFTIVSNMDSQQGLIPDGKFDFVLLAGSSDIEHFDRVLKVDGILAIHLKDESVHVLEEPSNYRVLYIRKYESTVVALKKISLSNDVKLSNRKLCNAHLKAKRVVALKGLDNPLLEPPRQAPGESTAYLKNIKYLPELIGSTLEGYRRRVFITVGPKNEDNVASVEWFYHNYPLKNQKFVVYKLESSSDGNIGVSDWLRKNVLEGDYVVMKAEAEIVEELLKTGNINTVDELFFECKNQWGHGPDNIGERAYWECLSLYGRVRDKGVAIHQWWH